MACCDKPLAGFFHGRLNHAKAWRAARMIADATARETLKNPSLSIFFGSAYREVHSR